LFVRVNNIDMFYEVSGSGPPLLLLHGNGEDHNIFDKLVKKLAPSFTTYALDSREHGQSGKSGVCSYDAMAEDAFAVVKALGLGKVRTIGFSDGAIISLLLSMRHPEVLESQALLGVNLSPADLTQESLEFVQKLYRESGSPLLKMILEEPNIKLEELKGVKTPSLVLAGEKDFFKPETFVNVKNALPNAQLKIMEGHNHESYIVDNDILYPLLLEFFQKAGG
jgi:pimeloyl-ACP methyl ester carboxylesterase